MRPSRAGRRAGRGDEQRAEDRDGRHFSGRVDCGTGGTGIPLRRGIKSVRKRIGVMVPSTNTTCEADFNMVVPRGITVHGQRLWMTNDATGDAAYQRMNGQIETGARYLATARVDVIAYGCTTGSFYRGPGWDREMLALIERKAGGLLCSCTAWRSVEGVEGLEGGTGKPVVTSNQATIWTALGAIGVTQPVGGFGRLFERPAPAAVGAAR